MRQTAVRKGEYENASGQVDDGRGETVAMETNVPYSNVLAIPEEDHCKSDD